MCQQKQPIMQGISKTVSKLKNWKQKAIERRRKIDALQKRQKELTASREGWKQKYKAVKAENLDLIHQNHILQKRIAVLEKADNLVEDKPRNHSYGSMLMLMLLQMRMQGNISLRGCLATMKIVSLVLGIELRLPCASTLLNWEKKLGLDRLNTPSESCSDWAIILDESISIGPEKLLLTLGVDLSVYEFGQALNFSDVNVLDMAIASSWKGLDISERLADLKEDSSIVYGVTDGGTNLVKALKESDLDRVSDCTHAIGNLLKKQYNNCANFQAFSKQCGVLKRQVQLGQYAEYAPPKQRTKGRFLNLQALSNWAFKLLKILDSKTDLPDEIKQKLEWLKEYESLIKEIHQQCRLMNRLFSILKTKGLNNDTQKECLDLLEKEKCPDVFRKGVEQYLSENVVLLNQKQSLICCSDIIESYFGKYKYINAKSGQSLITDACLCLANFNPNFGKKEVKKAMENVKIIDLKQWKEQNCSDSILKKKKKLFKNTG